MNISVINNPYAAALITDARDIETEKDTLRKRLYELGRITSESIIGDGLVSKRNVSTPMGLTYSGLSLPKITAVVISTRDDFNHFAEGISSCFSNVYRGFMDFRGERGPEALHVRRRAYEYPTLKAGEVVDTLIIAKSILATGCTAISLTKSAMAQYYPKKLIIASIFYSQQGIDELLAEIPNIDTIYIHGAPDTLDNDGMLIPGVGNIDVRLQS